MRKINNVFLVSQTYSRQCPPLLICMHNLVIVLYVTTMTTSNAFGGNTKRKHYNMAKTNNAKCIPFVGSSTTASLILTWNEISFSIEKNIWHFLMRFLGGIFGVFFGILERKKLPDNFQNKAKGAQQSVTSRSREFSVSLGATGTVTEKIWYRKKVQELVPVKVKGDGASVAL